MRDALNFSAGPSIMPEAVLKRAQKEILNFKHHGLSVMEMSHRSLIYEEIHEKFQELLRKAMDIPDTYEILLYQGGATSLFSYIPCNLLGESDCADYVISGHFSKCAYEAASYFYDVKVAKSSEDELFSYIPQINEEDVRKDAKYLFICQNNTAYGTRFTALPKTKVPIVADVSSHILSEKINVSDYGLLFAGAQKNLGSTGLTVVVIRKNLLQKKNIPSLFSFKEMAAKNSLINTPPTYSIYLSKLYLEWFLEEGGIHEIEKRNHKKAAILYDYLDASSFYSTRVNKEDRSLMNVCFYLPNETLTALFLEEAQKRNMINLKGYRLAKGIRASIYNAMPKAYVKKLREFMSEFEKQYKGV